MIGGEGGSGEGGERKKKGAGPLSPLDFDLVGQGGSCSSRSAIVQRSKPGI